MSIADQFFPEMHARRMRGECPFCGCPNAHDTIKDENSEKEFEISGLCQKCQDETFTELSFDYSG
jgi:hypothetical protein